MKISQMIKREDFYQINEKTLNEYFKGQGKKRTLYIYPELNAILTSNPSKNVKRYLMTEYAIKGNFLKALVAKCYVFLCLNSFGVMSSSKIRINCDITNDILIYPCNKKYRIFDFKNRVVDVIAKNGFPIDDLKHEIDFRVNNNLPFVPEVTKWGDNYYSEKIIEGIPLARYGGDTEKYKKESLVVLKELSDSRGETKKVLASEYAGKLFESINDYSAELLKNINKSFLLDVSLRFLKMANVNKEIEIGISHGDLQPGNIWVKNTGEMIIIDWESWKVRSTSYDYAALYNNLRNGGISEYIINSDDKVSMAIVCLEDIVYRINELNNLPYDFGEKEFDKYILSLKLIVGGDDDNG